MHKVQLIEEVHLLLSFPLRILINYIDFPLKFHLERLELLIYRWSFPWVLQQIWCIKCSYFKVDSTPIVCSQIQKKYYSFMPFFFQYNIFICFELSMTKNTNASLINLKWCDYVLYHFPLTMVLYVQEQFNESLNWCLKAQH